MHDNNEKLTSAFPKEQPTDAESGWEKLELEEDMKRGSLSRKYCTEFLPSFPWECKEDQVLEPLFIQTSVGRGKSAKSECDKIPPTQLMPCHAEQAELWG